MYFIILSQVGSPGASLLMLPSWRPSDTLEWRSFLHFSKNDDRWQEVTFRSLSTSTDGRAKQGAQCDSTIER
jgi:hypothetical protein